MDRVFLGKYRVATTKSPRWWEECRGRFGFTCPAEEVGQGRKVVLEFVPAFLLGEAEREQLRKTAATAQKLRHVNIPALYDFGEEAGQFVYVMEPVDGITAQSWVAMNGPVSVSNGLWIALQVVSALRAAAYHDLHHPAIHPGNLMIVAARITEGGWPLVKVLHFLSAHRPFDAANPTPADAALFASPEQIAGGPVDFHSETYSLGATLWFLLRAPAPRASSGQTEGKSAPAPMAQQLADVPESVRPLLRRMLSENRDERPGDDLALEEEIRVCLREANTTEATIPTVEVSVETQPAPPERTFWRRSTTRFLATAGAAALAAVAFRGITERAEVKKTTPDSKLTDKRDRPVDSGASQTAAVRPEESPTGAMNFSVVSPSHPGSSQIQSLPLEPPKTIVQNASLEPAPPAEGPNEDPVVEKRTPARRGPPPRQ
jgi:serine/threonine protein kinase